MGPIGESLTTLIYVHERRTTTFGMVSDPSTEEAKIHATSGIGTTEHTVLNFDIIVQLLPPGARLQGLPPPEFNIHFQLLLRVPNYLLRLIDTPCAYVQLCTFPRRLQLCRSCRGNVTEHDPHSGPLADSH